MPNPIYTPGDDGTPARSSSLVVLAGIVGVPWQDIADDSSQLGPSLRYLTTAEMTSSSPNRWDVILGDPDIGRLPTDPFMIESVDQRPLGARNPVPGVLAAITPAMPAGETNPINGREQNVINRDDLQYACIFPFATENPCSPANADGCDCNASEREYNRPTCSYPLGGGDGTQTHAKAYPSVRQLQVLKGLGQNAVVASVCAKNVVAQGNPSQDPSYGYNPAMGALVRKFREAFRPSCLPRTLATQDGRVACQVVETRLPGADGCSCDTSTGRTEVSSTALRGRIMDGLTASALCGGRIGVSCTDYCQCELEQFSGAALESCQNASIDPGNLYGFCYVDEETNPELIADCLEDERQTIRFLGQDVPAQGSMAFLVCGN